MDCFRRDLPRCAAKSNWNLGCPHPMAHTIRHHQSPPLYLQVFRLRYLVFLCNLDAHRVDLGLLLPAGDQGQDSRGDGCHLVCSINHFPSRGVLYTNSNPQVDITTTDLSMSTMSPLRRQRTRNLQLSILRRRHNSPIESRKWFLNLGMLDVNFPSYAFYN